VRTKKKTSKPVKTVKKKPRNNILTVRSNLKKAAPEKHCFHLCDGKILKHYKELADALAAVDDNVFFHHANADKNDFAAWVKEVFKEEQLADDLLNAQNKDQARLVIYKFIAERLW